MSMFQEFLERTERDRKQYDSPLDPGIALYVQFLNDAGIETFESCQGGEGHCYPEPTVRFHGGRGEGFKAVAVALQHALPVSCLRRIWTVNDGEPTGPYWEMTFSPRPGPLESDG
jgi:hypothetical protein